MGARGMDAGDVALRIELRKRLGCKSANWYFDNIFPEMLEDGGITFLDLAGSNSCHDENFQCDLWRSGGECESNPAFMHSRCKRSCGICQVSSFDLRSGKQRHRERTGEQQDAGMDKPQGNERGEDERQLQEHGT